MFDNHLVRKWWRLIKDFNLNWPSLCVFEPLEEKIGLETRLN